MNKENSPIWFNILEHFDKKNYLKNGATIPFLIGSEQIINPDKKLLSIAEFLNQILEQKLPSYINLMKCPKLGEIVIGIIDIQTVTFLKRNPRKIYKTYGGLMITDNSYDNKNWDEIVTDVQDNYQYIIDDLKFTFEDGQWTYFTTEEIQRIKESNQ
jgi:hypothetical protein